jgi:hypothetical protein
MSLLCAGVFGVYSANGLAATRNKALVRGPFGRDVISHPSDPEDARLN